MVRLRVFMALVLAVAVNGCTKPGQSNQPSGPVNVYVAGSEMTSSGLNSAVMYWKNGIAVPLQDTNSGFQEMTIAVSGSDVYVAGSDSYNIMGNNFLEAVYWKNGQEVGMQFQDGPTFTEAYANDVKVSGSDVYLCGQISDEFHDIGVYWKNGVETHLADTTLNTNSSALGMFISGSDLYVAGYEFSGSFNPAAVYWKNGVEVILTDGTYSAQAESIFVSGSDVYVAGTENNGNQIPVVKYWKNGVPYNCTNGTGFAGVSGIVVSGGHVYVGGWESNGSHDVAEYWKDQSVVPVTDGTGNASCTGIAVWGSDVYMAGTVNNGTYDVAVYWKNGIVTNLTDGLSFSAGTTGIALGN